MLPLLTHQETSAKQSCAFHKKDKVLIIKTIGMQLLPYVFFLPDDTAALVLLPHYAATAIGYAFASSHTASQL